MRAAAHAPWTRVVFSQGLLGRMRVDRRLPALSSRRGPSPAQEMRWPAVGKRVMRTCHTGVHYTPVDSIAPCVQPWAVSQSLSATSPWVVVPKVRTSCVTDEPATTRAQATTVS